MTLPNLPSATDLPAADYRPLVELSSYADAQDLVDFLSDNKFPVNNVRIVGLGVHSVEQVLRRKTNGSAALQGAASGAWFGVLMGLLLALFVPGQAWLTMVLAAVAFAAVWGALFGFISHWLTRGKRDFSSVKVLEATTYEVQVAAEHLAEARRLARL